MGYTLIYITFPNKREAKKIAQILVKEKLAACCNIFPIESIYRWRGKIEREREFGIFVKTKTKLIDKIIKRVKELHSYETPCIISFPIEKGLKEYLNWIKKETK
jgi:periplasmic divalent cation tolerance protein